MADDKLPVSEIRKMSSEGKSEREIIHFLKQQGHSNEAISKSLSIALKNSIEPQHNMVQNKMEPQPKMPMSGKGDSSLLGFGGPQQEEINYSMTEEIQLEELIEEMINERWEEINDNLIEWDRQISILLEKMNQLEMRMNNIENKHDSVREDIRDMLGTTNDQMDTVEGRIGSMERAFKEFLPSFSENVKALSRVAERLEKPKSKK